MAHRLAARWLLLSGMLAAAVFVAIALSASLWAAPLLAWHLSAKLARPVAIGHLTIRFGEPVTVVAQDIVIGNPAGFPPAAAPLARVQHATVQIDVLASLRRQVLVIPSVEIEQPMIYAVATEDGRKNYLLPAAPRPRIGSLGIQGGQARVSLPALNADVDLTFATQVEAGTVPGPARLLAEAHGTFAGEPVDARLASFLPLDPQHAAQHWPVEIDVRNGPTQATVRAMLQSPSSLDGASAAFSVTGPDMARLRPLTGVMFPITPPYDLRGTLDAAAGTYRVTHASGRLGQSDLAGTMTVATHPGQRPEITTEIVSRSVDLRDILSLLGGKPGPPGTPGQTPEQQAQAAQIQRQAAAAPRLLPQTPLHASKLDQVNIHLAFRAQQIQGAAMPFDNLAFGLDVVDGAVNLHQVRLGIGDGTLDGNLWLTPVQDERLRARADLHFDRVDIGRLLWASGGYRGNGALNGIVRMDGTGRSVADILGDADGAVSLWMLGGDLSSLLVDVAGLRFGSALLSVLGGSPTTSVDCFVANLGLQHGILSTNTLLLDTANAVTEGRGTVNLRQERVDLRLRTQSKHLTIGVLPVPLLISGTLREPRAAPDPAAPAEHGGLAGALAALPMIQLGTDDVPRCKSAIKEARKD